MLKQRREAARLVAVDFLEAERAADAAAEKAAACVATMLAQRAAAGLPVDTGLEALRLVSDAANDLVRSRQRLVEAHRLLVEARTGIGLRAYGDESECPDGFASTTASDRGPRLVAAA